jgi:hypothetical protein
MPRKVFMCGHGMWDPKNGFFSLPPNTSFTMMVDVSKVLYTDDMYKICAGTYSGEDARVIGGPGAASRTCPNLTWTADDPKKIKICDDRLSQNPNGKDALLFFPNHIPNFLDSTRSITLKKFFAEYWEPAAHIAVGADRQAEFIWACCAYTKLKASDLGAELGVNAAMTGNRYDHLKYTGGNITLAGKSTPR